MLSLFMLLISYSGESNGFPAFDLCEIDGVFWIEETHLVQLPYNGQGHLDEISQSHI